MSHLNAVYIYLILSSKYKFYHVIRQNAKINKIEISRTIPMHFAGIMPDKERMTFIYLSGSGTDVNGKLAWQKVKGGTENLLAEMPSNTLSDSDLRS